MPPLSPVDFTLYVAPPPGPSGTPFHDFSASFLSVTWLLGCTILVIPEV
jgi:hypothetical protein